MNVQVNGPKDNAIIHDLNDMKFAETEKHFFGEKSMAQGHLINLDIVRGENMAPIRSAY